MQPPGVHARGDHGGQGLESVSDYGPYPFHGSGNLFVYSHEEISQVFQDPGSAVYEIGLRYQVELGL